DRTERGALTVAALLKVQRSYLPLMKQFGELLGFSPVSRSTLKIDDSADPENEDPREWAKWEWMKTAAQRHPEGSPEKEAQRQRLDYLHPIMYRKPARSRRRRERASIIRLGGTEFGEADRLYLRPIAAPDRRAARPPALHPESAMPPLPDGRGA